MLAVVVIDAGSVWGALRNFFFGVFGINAFIAPIFIGFISIMSALGKDDRKYKIKFIVLVDLDDKIKVDGMDIFDLFGCLDTRPNWENMTQEQRDKRAKAFEFFWNTSEEELYSYVS